MQLSFTKMRKNVKCFFLCFSCYRLLKMSVMRKSFSSFVSTNICNSHMSLYVSLSNVKSIRLVNNNVQNIKSFITISNSNLQNTENVQPKMSPSPPYPTLSDALSTSSSTENENVRKSTENEDAYLKPLLTSDLIRLGREFNKFYFNGE